MRNKTNEIYCANCAHYGENKCECADGLFHGIRISDSMSEADHDCKSFREAVYILTEAGYLDLAMREEGVELEDNLPKRICDRFFKYLTEAGILQN